MNYLEFKFKVNNSTESDIITAILGEIGFESFTEEPNCLLAYIQEQPENENKSLSQNITNNLSEVNITTPFTYTVIEQQNWNATWEKSFEPILVANKCIIRAPFHTEQNNILNIIIEPKMSFGTGHHQTTFLMLETLFEIDIKNKSVLDMGCGTAVLAIVAEKLQANNILAVDIEEWAFENALENVGLNTCSNITVLKGGAEQIGEATFDIIIANINKKCIDE